MPKKTTTDQRYQQTYRRQKADEEKVPVRDRKTKNEQIKPSRLRDFLGGWGGGSGV